MCNVFFLFKILIHSLSSCGHLFLFKSFGGEKKNIKCQGRVFFGSSFGVHGMQIKVTFCLLNTVSTQHRQYKQKRLKVCLW